MLQYFSVTNQRMRQILHRNNKLRNFVVKMLSFESFPHLRLQKKTPTRDSAPSLEIVRSLFGTFLTVLGNDTNGTACIPPGGARND